MEMQQDISKFIVLNLSSHKHFALATVGSDGKPWVVCLNLAHDKNFNIIWKSSKHTEHSKNIATNPNISVVIFSKTDGAGEFGFYANAVAHEVIDTHELHHVIDVRYSDAGKPAPDASEFMGDSLTRLYVAEISEAWVNDDKHLKQAVDLAVLRSIHADI